MLILAFIRYQPLGAILGDALEFSILAGIPICCASADGWCMSLLKHASDALVCLGN